MKPFTDEDLKRLKDVAEIHAKCFAECLVRPLTAKECMSLIARLEAAEALIKVSPKSGQDITSFWEAWDAWKTAAGKS